MLCSSVFIHPMCIIISFSSGVIARHLSHYHVVMFIISISRKSHVSCLSPLAHHMCHIHHFSHVTGVKFITSWASHMFITFRASHVSCSSPLTHHMCHVPHPSHVTFVMSITSCTPRVMFVTSRTSHLSCSSYLVLKLLSVPSTFCSSYKSISSAKCLVLVVRGFFIIISSRISSGHVYQFLCIKCLVLSTVVYQMCYAHRQW